MDLQVATKLFLETRLRQPRTGDARTEDEQSVGGIP